MRSIAAVFALLLSVSAFASADRYVDALEYQDGIHYDRFADATQALRKAFNHVCGDTFCEGDYQNLASLEFACSVENATGTLKSCVWTFAGSYSLTNAKTGKVSVESIVRSCAIDVDGVALDSFITEVLEAEKNGVAKRDWSGAVEHTLSGKSKSFYDQLVDCI